MRSEHDDSDAQWKEIVDSPIGDQRSEHRGGGQDGREEEKNHCLKDSKASRYLAQEPRHLGQQKDSKKTKERETVSGRKKGIQDTTGQHPIQRGKGNLGHD